LNQHPDDGLDIVANLPRLKITLDQEATGVEGITELSPHRRETSHIRVDDALHVGPAFSRSSTVDDPRLPRCWITL
jgi:hypothetical protein